MFIDPEEADEIITRVLGPDAYYNELEASSVVSTGDEFLLLTQSSDDPFYTSFAGRAEALDFLAACISEGSENLYKQRAWLIDVEAGTAEVIERLTANGFVTRPYQ